MSVHVEPSRSTREGDSLSDIGRIADIELSEALIRRFDTAGPRYTSYPTADRFAPEFD